MKVPKTIENELIKRGWNFITGEKWRVFPKLNWAGAYFVYKSKTCFITVTRTKGEYLIQILYAFPLLSSYVYKNRKFNVDLEKNKR